MAKRATKSSTIISNISPVQNSTDRPRNVQIVSNPAAFSPFFTDGFILLLTHQLYDGVVIARRHYERSLWVSTVRYLRSIPASIALRAT